MSALFHPPASCLSLSRVCLPVWHQCLLANINKVPFTEYANNCKIWPQLLHHQKIDFHNSTVSKWRWPVLFKTLSKFNTEIALKILLRDLWGESPWRLHVNRWAIAYEKANGRRFAREFLSALTFDPNKLNQSSGPRDFLCHVSKLGKNWEKTCKNNQKKSQDKLWILLDSRRWQSCGQRLSQGKMKPASRFLFFAHA